ncbi:chorismate mutase [Paenibacillus polymyxa]|jgi:chorismate mutase|uniref:chorismate mutase n=1 Tax=Paenibacillus polymyxa TaxID=1406 RepID=A0A0F0G353_PAEPO|nr:MULTISPECIES: chorismate mutase [Paenibacillus]AHM66542.1 protein-glutamate o-methyltransferase [Paenibacillus polymyxa SQR-21]AIY07464.1 chorismate mutase [Paenibacillus polymyxa]AUS27206.1 chorismate mutase protein-glutamate o-methyltransferase [Paenibacillus polymyxa]KAE8558326.1 chorismate mutase [Paenibacillus polymyxa]KAF6584312.1 chorismate mutase [Paenibacillus sp. EKM211P]
MYNRGIRGATTVTNNEANEILEATSQLLEEIVSYNEIQPEDISNVWITVTHDLDAAFPAMAIRQLDGWDMVPLMCALEIPVAGSLPKCIRLMVQVNTDKSQREMKHVYLNGAQMLRPDLASQGK